MPSRYISRDGEILADRFTDEPYIFQNVHTLGGAARHTAAHTALLRAAAKSLFGFDPEITADELLAFGRDVSDMVPEGIVINDYLH